MKILTTVKKVVDVELNIHVKDGAIVEDGLQYVINAWDENAVEAAVQLKENNGAETTLVSIGGGDNTDMIRRCYAMGIENGIHIEDPALAKADSSIFAKVLQKVYEKGTMISSSPENKPRIRTAARPGSCWPSIWDCLASAT